MKNESFETKVRKSLKRKNALIERYKNYTNIELADLQAGLLYSASVAPIIHKEIQDIEDVLQIREDKSMEMEEQGE